MHPTVVEASYRGASELSDADRSLRVLSSFSPLPVCHRPFSSVHSLLLCNWFPPMNPCCLQINWDASPEQKKQCLSKGRDNKVRGCSSVSSLSHWSYQWNTSALCGAEFCLGVKIKLTHLLVTSQSTFTVFSKNWTGDPFTKPHYSVHNSNNVL